MSMEKKNKKAFVTGGSRGIGRGIARALARKGYDIAFTYNSSLEEAESLTSELEEMGVKSVHFQASFEKDGVSESVTEKAIEAIGGIDVLVCNAGLTKHESILTLTEEQVDFIYKLNYRSYMMCAKAAANHMAKRSEPGRIIFISSTRGIRSYPESNIYGSLKAGLIHSVESLALQLADYDITVNCIAPGATKVRGDLSPEGLREGFIPTKVPLKRFGSIEEVGHAAVFLASDEAAYITGETIRIDGGLILGGPKERPE